MDLEVKTRVIKRNGEEVDFRLEKIVNAIKKANEEVENIHRMNDFQIIAIAEKIAQQAEEFTHAVNVEDIQDMVETGIMEMRGYEVAQKYVRYRYKRELTRKSNTTDNGILALIDHMNEEVKMYMDEAKEQMQNALVHLENELAKIRAGKANPKILNDVLVDYYGSPTPLSQVANITAPDPRTIAVQPWEKNMLGPIQKAIMNANLGFNPDNNGEVVRINVPPLTAERRKELVKQSKGVGETAKVSIRNARRDAIDEFKKMVKSGLPEDEAKDAEDEVQKITDSYNKIYASQ